MSAIAEEIRGMHNVCLLHSFGGERSWAMWMAKRSSSLLNRSISTVDNNLVQPNILVLVTIRPGNDHARTAQT
jgi:hypothetical protein